MRFATWDTQIWREFHDVMHTSNRPLHVLRITFSEGQIQALHGTPVTDCTYLSLQIGFVSQIRPLSSHQQSQPHVFCVSLCLTTAFKPPTSFNLSQRQSHAQYTMPSAILGPFPLYRHFGEVDRKITRALSAIPTSSSFTTFKNYNTCHKFK